MPGALPFSMPFNAVYKSCKVKLILSFCRHLWEPIKELLCHCFVLFVLTLVELSIELYCPLSNFTLARELLSIRMVPETAFPPPSTKHQMLEFLVD